MERETFDKTFAPDSAFNRLEASSSGAQSILSITNSITPSSKEKFGRLFNRIDPLGRIKFARALIGIDDFDKNRIIHNLENNQGYQNLLMINLLTRESRKINEALDLIDEYVAMLAILKLENSPNKNDKLRVGEVREHMPEKSINGALDIKNLSKVSRLINKNQKSNFIDRLFLIEDQHKRWKYIGVLATKSNSDCIENDIRSFLSQHRDNLFQYVDGFIANEKSDIREDIMFGSPDSSPAKISQQNHERSRRRGGEVFCSVTNPNSNKAPSTKIKISDSSMQSRDCLGKDDIACSIS